MASDRHPNLDEPRPVALRRTVETFSASAGENQKGRSCCVGAGASDRIGATGRAPAEPRSSRRSQTKRVQPHLGIWIPKDLAQSAREIPLAELRRNRTSI